MSSVRWRRAVTAPVKNIRAAHSTGRLSSSNQTLRSSPNGVASSLPKTLLPTSRPGQDREREDEREDEAVAHLLGHVVHRVATMAALTMSAGSSARADRRLVVGMLGLAGLVQRIAQAAGHVAARALEPALARPRRRSSCTEVSRRVVGARSRSELPGWPPRRSLPDAARSAVSTTRFSLARYWRPTCSTTVAVAGVVGYVVTVLMGRAELQGSSDLGSSGRGRSGARPRAARGSSRRRPPRRLTRARRRRNDSHARRGS